MFTCNVCGSENVLPAVDRETKSCRSCGSNVRIRALMRALTQEFYGADLTLRDLPVLKSIRGLGISDSSVYADILAEKFDYANTQYHQEPFLDLCALTEGDRGCFDFIVCSEVLEHVRPPVELAFENIARALGADGRLLMTVPYTPGDESREHFADLAEYRLTTLDGVPVLVGRRRDGSLVASDDLTFHGGRGDTLEMRLFSADGLRELLRSAGFRQVTFQDDGAITARKSETAALSMRCARELAVQHCELVQQKREAESEAAALLALANALREELEDERPGELDAALAPLLEARQAQMARLEAEVDERTRWAQGLDLQLQQRREQVEQLEAELRSRTDWAMRLDEEVRVLRGQVESARQPWLTRHFFSKKVSR